MKVAFVIPQFGSGWLGGVNYFRNLFHAISTQEAGIIEPVLFVSPEFGEQAALHFPEVTIVCTNYLRRGSMAHFSRKCIELALGKDIVLERIILKRQISLCSHGPTLGKRSQVSTIPWIPDFQHLHLPHFFSAREIRNRSRGIFKMGRECTRLLVSSNSARDDLEKFMPQCLPKVRVLRFSPTFNDCSVIAKSSLENKYNFRGKYIFLPNQFWAHKNHLTVISALSLLNNNGIKIISTGATEDYRNPQHFSKVRASVDMLGLRNQFLILGVIPYQDMVSLMYHAHALINPSLFEGWSTTVEEAKCMRKRLLLSDIPVHREQAQGQASYFPPLSVSQCATAIASLWEGEHTAPNADFMEHAKTASKQFGLTYGNIIRETVQNEVLQ